MSIVHTDGQGARESLLVRRLIDQGVRDPRVLAAFARVPRHFFVPEESQAEAQADRPKRPWKETPAPATKPTGKKRA